MMMLLTAAQSTTSMPGGLKFAIGFIGFLILIFLIRWIVKNSSSLRKSAGNAAGTVTSWFGKKKGGAHPHPPAAHGHGPSVFTQLLQFAAFLVLVWVIVHAWDTGVLPISNAQVKRINATYQNATTNMHVVRSPWGVDPRKPGPTISSSDDTVIIRTNYAIPFDKALIVRPNPGDKYRWHTDSERHMLWYGMSATSGEWFEVYPTTKVYTREDSNGVFMFRSYEGVPALLSDTLWTTKTKFKNKSAYTL